MRRRGGSLARWLTMLLGGSAMLLEAPVPARAELGTLVPAYFAPWAEPGKTDWGRLASSAGQIPVTAIMTADAGLGLGNLTAEEVAAYQGVVGNLQKSGGSVIGYVPTSFGKADLGTVETQIAYYFKTFGVNGIFLDEWSQDATSYLGYYKDLAAYVRSLGGSVFGNPGIPFNDVPAFADVADNLTIYEGPLRRAADAVGGPSFFDTTNPTTGDVDPGFPYGLDWFKSQPSSKITNLVYAAATADDMKAAIEKAVRNNAGYVYVTDDDLPNPWDRLPTYWEQEVATIAAINAVPEPSSLAIALGMGGFGLAALARSRRKTSRWS